MTSSILYNWHCSNFNVYVGEKTDTTGSPMYKVALSRFEPDAYPRHRNSMEDDTILYLF